MIRYISKPSIVVKYATSFALQRPIDTALIGAKVHLWGCRWAAVELPNFKAALLHSFIVSSQFFFRNAVDLAIMFFDLADVPGTATACRVSRSLEVNRIMAFSANE